MSAKAERFPLAPEQLQPGRSYTLEVRREHEQKQFEIVVLKKSKGGWVSVTDVQGDSHNGVKFNSNAGEWLNAECRHYNFYERNA